MQAHSDLRKGTPSNLADRRTARAALLAAPGGILFAQKVERARRGMEAEEPNAVP